MHSPDTIPPYDFAPGPVIDPATDPAAALVELAAALVEERHPARPIAAAFASAVESWLQGQALEQALGLGGAPGIEKARTLWHRRQRDAALRTAYELVEGKNPSRRFRALAKEIRTFEAIVWPTWKNSQSPPPKPSELRSALFRARQHGGPLPASERGLWKICLKY